MPLARGPEFSSHASAKAPTDAPNPGACSFEGGAVGGALGPSHERAGASGERGSGASSSDASGASPSKWCCEPRASLAAAERIAVSAAFWRAFSAAEALANRVSRDPEKQEQGEVRIADKYIW